MFTGIVEEMGKVQAAEKGAGGARLRVACSKALQGTQVGSSVAVNGVCVTAVRLDAGGFEFQAVPETLRRTNLGFLEPGEAVNLERPMGADARFGGHMVQGHVDGLATVLSISPEGESLRYQFETSPGIARYLVEKGFVALDGASLTVTDVEGNRFGVALIPHTIKNVVMGTKRPGYRVNVEVDLVAKYVEKLAGAYLEAGFGR